MRWGWGVDAAHGKDMPPLLPLHPSLNVPFWPFHSLLGAFNGIEVDYRLLSYGSTGTGDFDPLETAHCSPQISSFQQASLTHISMLACVALGNYNKVKGVVRKPFKARNVDKCRPCESALVAYGADQTTRKKDCATAHMLQPLIIGRTRFKAQWGRVNVTNPRYHLSHSGSLQPQCETGAAQWEDGATASGSTIDGTRRSPSAPGFKAETYLLAPFKVIARTKHSVKLPPCAVWRSVQ